MPVTSVNMGMTIPTTDDPSPDYVTNYYNCLQTLDGHDHTSGNGVPVPVAGLNINQDLDLTGPGGGGGPFNLANARSVRMVNQSATLSDGDDVNETNVVNGDLWYNNAAGQAVQITSGGGLNFTGTGGFGGDYVTAGAQANYDDANKVYNFFQAGGSVFCDIAGADFHAHAGAPYFEWIPSSGHKVRLGLGSDNLWVMSIDAFDSGGVDADQRFTDINFGMVVRPYSKSGEENPAWGLGQDPGNFQYIGTSGLATNFLVQDNSGLNSGPGFLGVFTKSAGSSIVVLQGTGQADTINSQASLFAAAHTYAQYGGTITMQAGILNSPGATALGATAGDFAIFNGFNLMTIANTGGNVGFGKGSAADKVDINGDVRALGGFRMILGPYVMGTASISTTPEPFYTAACDINAAVGTSGSNGWVAPFAGSVMGISATYTNGSTAIITHEVFKNGSLLTGATVAGASGNSGSPHATFAKDAHTFAAGDVLTLFAVANTSTSLTSSAAIMVEC